MKKQMQNILTDLQIRQYRKQGFIQSIKILNIDESRYYRNEVERTCLALGNHVTRFDGAHFFFHWAWKLSTHPRLLDCMQQLLGPNILLKSTRLFYKHGNSTSYVGWHQDGYTDGVSSPCRPTIWLGLSDATVNNGCLCLVPGSHTQGLIAHDQLTPRNDLANTRLATLSKISSAQPIIMRAGEMSLHHPLMIHGSAKNTSNSPRIGFSATYSTPELLKNKKHSLPVRSEKTTTQNTPAPTSLATFTKALSSYRSSHHSVFFSPL